MITHPNVKLNLGLRVLGKRPDGYHELETVFYPCDAFSDTLEIITGDDFSRTSASLFERYKSSEIVQGLSPDGSVMITIAREGGVDWDPLKDLTVKAIGLLAERYKLPALKIYLEKTSPVGAGLGGGSADGAFALRMVNELCSLGLSEAELVALAASLGSDCAFFVYNRPMLGTGRGEVLTPIDLDLSSYDVQVVIPEGISVSTAEAYRGLQRPAVAPGGMKLSLPPIFSHPVAEWKDLLVNDFESSVFARHPALAEIKGALYEEGALYAAMSGSGSALYGIFARQGGAQ